MIFGADNRKNVIDFTGNKQTLGWTDSVAIVGRTPGKTAAVCKQTTTGTRCYLNTLPRTKCPLPGYSNANGLCSDQTFASERWTGDCTAFRVGEKLFVTAGHCLGPNDGKTGAPKCSETELAFGFQTASFNPQTNKPNVPGSVRRRSDVYKCSKVLAHRHPLMTDTDRRDYAVFEVDRPVLAHHLLRIRTLGVAKVGDSVAQLGHGLGLPLKVVAAATIKLLPDPKATFEYSADVVGGDSGGPVIDLATGLVTGLVTARPDPPGGEFTLDSTGSCYRYGASCSELDGCPAFAGDPKFAVATDLSDANLQGAIPTPPPNPTLFADLDLDGAPDEVSLKVVAGFYALDLKISSGQICPLCPIITPIPAAFPAPDLSPAIHIGDFNGDQRHDVLVVFDGYPPAYADGKSLLTLSPFSLAQSFLSGSVWSPTPYSSFSVADFNEDGIDDLRSQDTSGTVRTFMGTRSGPITSAGLAPAVEVPPECGESSPRALNWSSLPFMARPYEATRAVAVVPADVVGVAGGGTLLAIDCPGPTKKNQIKLLDPRSGAVKKTIALTGGGEWRSFTYRLVEKDLLALSSPHDPMGNYTVFRIPLSSGSSAAAQTLIVRKQDGIATGVGWHASAGRIRVLVDAGAPRVDRFAPNNSFVIDDFVDVAPCIQGPYEKTALVGGLAVSGEVEVGACNHLGLGRDKTNLLNLGVIQGSKRLSENALELFLHDIECDPLTFETEPKNVIWGVSRSGRMIRAFEVDGATCGFAGFPPTSKLCVTPGDGQPEIVAVYSGAGASFFQGADGRIWASGDNSLGQLGLGGIPNVLGPTLVPPLQTAKGIATSSTHTLAVLGDGTVVATGDNSSGQLGRTDVGPSGHPMPIPSLTAAAVAAGDGFSVALLVDGTVWTWGANDAGQLGDGTTLPRAAPAPVASDVGPIVAIAAGGRFVLALDENGQIWAWGANERGQLGIGSESAFSATPVRVAQSARANPDADRASAIAAGRAHALAATADGLIIAWGENSRGQLGKAPSSPATTPVLVPGAAGIRVVAAGSAHSVALTDAGSVFAWGANDHGELGDGTTQERATPLPVLDRCSRTGTVRAASSVAAGAAHTLAVGSVLAWGSNAQGQLGLGSSEDASTASPVVFNHAPSCASATALPGVVLWPPNGALFDVSVSGVIDPDGDPVQIEVTGVSQDESQQAPGQGSVNPDAFIVQGKAKLRAERSGQGDGRVYHLRFRASDPGGAACTGVIRVCVPHNGKTCGDGGPLHVSTEPPGLGACQSMPGEPDDCHACSRTQCCGELTACAADAACTSGGPDGRGEFVCLRDCLGTAVATSYDLVAASVSCAASCATKSKKLSPKTSSLLSCIAGSVGAMVGGHCAAECLGGDASPVLLEAPR